MRSRKLQGREDEGGGQRMKREVTGWMEALTENNKQKTSLRGSRKQQCHVTGMSGPQSHDL